MLTIKRTWLLPAIVITFLLYYLFWLPTDRSDETYTYPANGPDGLFHLIKQRDKYPVADPVSLPTISNVSIPKIQFDFASQPESAEEKSVREERKAAIKAAFVHTFEGYKKHAWGRDEVAPITGTYRSSFGGWGATLVDSLDTLWIMGLQNEFTEAVDVAMKIDFTTNTEETLNIFETTIRYLGGFLAAYDLTAGKYPALLDKTKELAEIIFTAFDTPNRMPVCRWQWRKSAIGHSLLPAETTLLAEFGSMTVEFTRLAQLTGENKYFDAVQRIKAEMSKAQAWTAIPGLWPTIVNAKDIKFDYNHFTLGGMADSTYEYLPKEYLLLGGADLDYKNMYISAIEAAEAHLFFRPMVPGSADILFSGNAGATGPRKTILDPQGQHLGCFVPGMVAMGSRIFDRPADLDVARRLLDGCIWAYNATASGLMPETFHLVPCQEGIKPAPPGQCDWDEDKWYTAIHARQEKIRATSLKTPVEAGKIFAKQKLILPGFTDHGDNRYILRPEAIESVFILYRMTGDRKYQDIAWRMWQSIHKATRTELAYAAVADVRTPTPLKSDRMESFFLAETLKYFYLIFDEPTMVSLDDYVYNTEAHPLRRPS